LQTKEYTPTAVHREYILNVHDGTTELIRAMRTIICWQKMREICLSRTTCKGCQFYKNGLCDRQTTDEILKEAKTVFRQYLIGIDMEI
jgi:hypothetical protein